MVLLPLFFNYYCKTNKLVTLMFTITEIISFSCLMPTLLRMCLPTCMCESLNMYLPLFIYCCTLLYFSVCMHMLIPQQTSSILISKNKLATLSCVSCLSQKTCKQLSESDTFKYDCSKMFMFTYNYIT